MSTEQAKARADDTSVTVTDILFDCPACGKSLVVDEAAEGMIVDCPQCRSNVIVPPQSAKSESSPPVTKEDSKTTDESRPPVGHPPASDAPPQKRLALLTGQLKEIQTQRTEVTGRIAARLNDVNRDLVMLARLETSQQKLLNEWNQLVEQVSPAESIEVEEADLEQPAVIGASINGGVPTRVPFRRR